MTRISFAFIFAAVLSVLAPAALVHADPADTSALAADATEAGTAAGIVNQCHSDAAPIQAAFLRALDAAKLDAQSRSSLWSRYRQAEVSTLEALSSRPATDCTETNGIIQDTVHRLEMPQSQS
jgi:hypothetical protein